MRRTSIFATIMLAGLLPFAQGCGGSSSSSDGGTGTLSLAITDAPVDGATALWMSFTEVTLQGVGGASDQGPYAIPEERQSINLMGYTGTSSAVLVDGLNVPAGMYKVRLAADLTFNESEQASWIEFDADTPECSEPLPDDAVWSPVDSADSVDMETCRYPMTIPSGEQSGFRPKGEILITAGGTSDFTVEFDLRKNVVNPSNPNDIAYKLKPTGLRLVDDTEAGSIAGEVLLGDDCSPDAARVYLFDRTGEKGDFVPDDIHDDNPTYVTSTSLITQLVGEFATYRYLIGFVPLGDAYAVALTCEDSDDPEIDEESFGFVAQASGITVTAGDETIKNLP